MFFLIIDDATYIVQMLAGNYSDAYVCGCNTRDSHHCEEYECETGSSVNEPLLVISTVLSLSLIQTENRALNLCATLCCIFGFITVPF